MHTKDRHLLNRVLKILAGSYIIIFIPLLLSYLALRHLAVFTEKMLFYALIPLAVVLLIFFMVYVIRVARTGHFWSTTYDHKGS